LRNSLSLLQSKLRRKIGSVFSRFLILLTLEVSYIERRALLTVLINSSQWLFRKKHFFLTRNYDIAKLSIKQLLVMITTS
jgi:hypothetical protein